MRLFAHLSLVELRKSNWLGDFNDNEREHVAFFCLLSRCFDLEIRTFELDTAS
jgi:hypothetical protein